MQQYLPFTVLKQQHLKIFMVCIFTLVATVLTVYGIETLLRIKIKTCCSTLLQQYLPFTVLKLKSKRQEGGHNSTVATVLTVYGIETTLSFILLEK